MCTWLSALFPSTVLQKMFFFTAFFSYCYWLISYHTHWRERFLNLQLRTVIYNSNILKTTLQNKDDVNCGNSKYKKWYDRRSGRCNLSNCKLTWNWNFGTSTGFEPKLSWVKNKPAPNIWVSVAQLRKAPALKTQTMAAESRFAAKAVLSRYFWPTIWILLDNYSSRPYGLWVNSQVNVSHKGCEAQKGMAFAPIRSESGYRLWPSCSGIW